MAKPDPKQLKKEGEDLKALFAKIKKKQHNCAILMAKDGMVIEAHIKKSSEILLKLAKKNGGSAKGAWGTVTMDGQTLKLDPINDKVPGNLPKLFKSYLGARGLKFRLEIIEPGKTEDSSEQVAAEEQAPSQGAVGEDSSAPDGQDDETRRATMKNWLDSQKPQINVILKNKASENAKAMMKAVAGYAKALKADKLDNAQAALDDAKGVIEKADEEFTLSDNQRAAIMQDLARMEREMADMASRFA